MFDGRVGDGLKNLLLARSGKLRIVFDGFCDVLRVLSN